MFWVQQMLYEQLSLYDGRLKCDVFVTGADTENNLLLWLLETYPDIDLKNAWHCHIADACD